MITRTLSCFAKMLVVGALVAAPAQPGVVLFDDFESGSLSPSKWLIPGSGQVVTDPLNANNKALSFGQLKAGGDLFSVPLDLSKGPINISFDYLGLARGTNIGTDTGGFVIVDLPNSFAGYVLVGTSVSGFPIFSNMLNLTPGVWHHISMTFAPSLVQAGNGSKVVFEQWSGSPNPAGNAYFDNIQVSTTPEPGSMLLAGAGILLVLVSRARVRG
ncbi:MAG: PEP-CTERM sorting domain-containing protein [Bryobacterales bacterium]|nr:PEP-CTERM sorting domain-containing protein [Bryobacterales bacterium]